MKIISLSIEDKSLFDFVIKQKQKQMTFIKEFD